MLKNNKNPFIMALPVLLLTGILTAGTSSLTGCSGGTADNAPHGSEEISVDYASADSDTAAGEVLSDTESVSTRDSAAANTQAVLASTLTQNSAVSPAVSAFPAVVWLGDSLTQGSLGDDNHNTGNPQAPWRVLADISGWNVAGYGYYGYTTSDILWKFGEDGGVRDPSKIYVFWVGSNDFHDSPDNIKNVINEIDQFNSDGGLTKYLVLGTTNRGDMDPTAYIGINQVFAQRYGINYLDIMPYVAYGPDKIHLTKTSYRNIAAAVYNKLNELYGH